MTSPDKCRGSIGRSAWLTLNLKVLSLVSLLQDTASELLYPILPLFLTTTLVAPVAVVAVMEGIADGLAAITKLVSGSLADRWRRRPLVGAGYGAAAAAKVLIALSTTWPLVLVARAIDRVGKGVRGAPRDALMAEEVPDEQLGRAFGFHRSMDTAGAIIGPLLGLALFELFHHHYRPVFLIAVVPAVLSAGAVMFVHERPRSAPTPEGWQTPPTNSARLPRGYWLPFTILTLFAFLNFSDALLILRAKHLGLGVPAVIAAYALYNVTYSLASFPAGVLADRHAKPKIIATGFAIFGLAYTALGVATSAMWVWPIFAFYGTYTALTDGVAKAWIIETVPTTVRGRGLGLQGGAAGVGAIVAGAWSGLFWNGTGRGPLVIAGMAAIVLAIVVFAVTKTIAPKRSGRGAGER